MIARWLVALALASPALHAANVARTLDDFHDASAWSVATSDQITATLRPADGGLCLDFDFHGVSGYAAMRRALPIDYPDNYEFRFCEGSGCRLLGGRAYTRTELAQAALVDITKASRVSPLLSNGLLMPALEHQSHSLLKTA